MNPSSAPANNENVAYGPLLASAGKLKRADQVNLVRALAGTLGMIAVFPNQLNAGSSPAPPKGGGKKKAKGPAQQAPSNPLSGSPEKKAFDAAKKAVAKATKDSGEEKLAGDHPLVQALERAKDQYFRALSSAKGENAAQAEPAGRASPSGEAPAKPTPKTSAPATPAKTGEAGKASKKK